jgi:putative ABC transport system permease protein
MPEFIAELFPNWSSMGMDVPALLVALGTGVATGVLIGIWPAWRFGRPTLVNALKDGARSATDRRPSKTRRGLVVAEVALAIVLLAAAGLLTRTLRNLHSVHPGFRADHVLTFRVTGPPRIPSDSTPLDSLKFERLATLLDALPGVIRAAPVYGAPYTHAASTNGFGIRGTESDQPGHRYSVRMIPAGARYFATLEIPILRGRPFTSGDKSGSPLVAIVDETVARRFFANQDPIGQFIRIDTLYWQIVGIAADTRYGARNRTVAMYPGEVYRPIAQWPWRQVQFVIRTRGSPLDVAPASTRVVRGFDHDLAVTRVETMESVIEEDVAPDRLISGMMRGDHRRRRSLWIDQLRRGAASPRVRHPARARRRVDGAALPRARARAPSGCRRVGARSCRGLGDDASHDRVALRCVAGRPAHARRGRSRDVPRRAGSRIHPRAPCECRRSDGVPT